jgi:kumamolisin
MTKGLKAFAPVGVLFASISLTTPLLAQNFGSLKLDPNFTVHISKNGAVITPSSSIPGGGDAHTNVHIFLRNGMPAASTVRPLVGPPLLGYFYETPASLACIYELVTPVTGCNPDTVSSVPTGGSKVVAIVDAYHAPNAMTDLAAFSAQFGLPPPTTANFEVVYATANGTQAVAPPPYDSGWEVEQSLDVQWAHAMAPNAKIILVEAASNSLAALLGAERLAGNLVTAAGGGQVSNSWGATEFAQEASYDSYFLTTGVVYFASTGDSPGTEWPSVSANVVAVGGTSVSRNPITGALVGEAAWDSAGGGQSAYIARPLYQNSVSGIIGGTTRGVPDVAAVANPTTGVWVYDRNQGGWIVVGGTSVASPVVAGITNNAGRFSSSSQVELTRIYADPSLSFDITRGICGPYAGYWAVVGWDFCTGVGSPMGKGVL